MNAPLHMLVKLARQSAASWTAMAADAFRGEASLETSNTIYRLRDGVFVSCASKRSQAFTTPESFRGLRLIGFLAYANGLWSLSPRWRAGVLAVFWRGGTDERSFIITSATAGWSIDASAAAGDRKRAPISGVVRRPAPPSMTRVLPAAAAAGDLR